MWVYQETPETTAAKALPEAIMPTAQEEQLKQKNGGVLPETSQEERQSIPAAFSERYGNTPEKAAVRRSKLSRETILLAAAYLLGTFLAGVAAARCVAGDADTLSYYLNCWQSLFSVQDAAGAVRLFRTEFFSSYKFRLPCQIQHPHCRTAKRQEQKQHPGKLTQKRACAGGLSSTPECG